MNTMLKIVVALNISGAVWNFFVGWYVINLNIVTIGFLNLAAAVICGAIVSRRKKRGV